jgi:hypothetical protein
MRDYLDAGASGAAGADVTGAGTLGTTLFSILISSAIDTFLSWL